MAKSRNPNGQGTYFKKGDRFYWRQKVDGQARELSAKTPKELQDKINKIADTRIIKGSCTVSDWLDKWLETCVKPLKKKATYEQYFYIIKSQIKPAIGKRKIQTIESIDIQSVISKMNSKGLAAKTMKHAKSIMNLAFERAKKDKIIASNPVEDIEIPKKQAKAKKVLSNEEITTLLTSMKHSRWIHSVKFLLVTGLRRGEMLALKWSDFDEVNKTLTIRESNSRSGLGDTKSAKIHTISLCDKAVLFLRDQKNQLISEKNPILLVDKLKESNLIFPTNKGLMLKPDVYYKTISKFAKYEGIHVSPHMFRHTFVYMTRNKLSLKQLQDALGHDESTTTLDIYGDIIDRDTDTIVKSLNEAFDKLDLEANKIENCCKVIKFEPRSSRKAT